MPPERLVKQAVKAGLEGVVITEHHHVWEQRELDELQKDFGAPGFVVLSGFEYTSSQGDLLFYGLTPDQSLDFVPGWTPEEAVEKARALGAACVAAHPTRSGLSFDERIFTLPLDAIEIQSVNLLEHEQRLAMGLTENTAALPIACSDAHRLQDVGRYSSEFFDPILSMADLKDALKRGRFRPAGNVPTRRVDRH